MPSGAESFTDRAARSPTRSNWAGFALWALVGALAALTVVGIASIGLFVMPFAVATGWLAARLAPHERNKLGVLSGIGVIALLVVWLNLNDDPGSFEIVPWLATGAVLLVLGIAAFAVTRRHSS
jgi:uncharacterized membrane protein